jgi:hypothetical protein
MKKSNLSFASLGLVCVAGIFGCGEDKVQSGMPPNLARADDSKTPDIMKTGKAPMKMPGAMVKKPPSAKK